MADWAKHAACRGVSIRHFFPENGVVSMSIRALCDACPVQTECLTEAFSVPGDLDLGFRAGLTARQRARLRAARSRAKRDAVDVQPRVDVPDYEPVPIRWDATVGKYRAVNPSDGRLDREISLDTTR